VKTHYTPAEFRRELIRDLGSFTHDPLAFVMWAWPWGIKGGPLENEPGPDVWQREQLIRIGEQMREDPHRLIREATASGHGIGKSTEVAFISHWALMTHEDTRGVITANTDTQLKTKTWPEIGKWYSMLRFPMLREMFRLEATSFFATQPGHERNWRIDAIPWSERNTEAFAGLHNAGKRTLLIMDEASAIIDSIFEVSEGALTDAETEMLWLVYGNPTRNTGRFKEAIEGKFRHLWHHRQIDSRTVKRTNKERLQEWIEAYGEDSDFVRVRVKGQFPRAGVMQFIGSDVVDYAMRRGDMPTPSSPIIFGVDVARYGDDKTVLAVRQGRDARSIPWLEWGGTDVQRDLMRVAGDIAEYAKRYRADAIFVDRGAMGPGLIDRLNQLNVPGVMGVNFGGKGGKVMVGEDLTIETANKRALMWASMREWLDGGTIPDDAELKADLIGVEYGYGADQVSLTLERKKDMKKRGLASPDKGDALALTFAAPVEKKIDRNQLPLPRKAYDPYSELTD
jgi:hypothetical protein